MTAPDDATVAAVPGGYGLRPAGHRLPDATHPGRVRLQVASLERSMAYYEVVLGMRAVSRGGGGAVLSAHGSDAPLVELVERAGAAPVPPRGRTGLYHFAILLPDRAALGRFVAHLVELGTRAGASDHLVSEALYLTDPDGLGIEVYADRPRSSWRVAGRELAMDTRPLDLDDVIRAAGGASWTGIPPGTVMGHVHLHVGDIERARAFYHTALGLDVMVSSYPGALFLAAGGYHHHLGVNTWAGPGATAPAPDDAQLLDWNLELPPADVDAAAAALESAGHVVTRTDGGWTATDPWGTRLLVSARPTA